jgi:hypothetical protein
MKVRVRQDATQPLYIDEPTESICCGWCSSFKGSNEVRVINQHVRHSKSHAVGRKKVTDSTDENLIQGVRDIRTFFPTN